MKIKRDQITGLALVVIGIIVAIMTMQFKVPFTLSYPGPKALPMIAVVGFVICGGGIFIQSTISKKEEPVFLLKGGWIRVILTLAVISLYVFTMKYLGYLIATPIAVFIITTMYAHGADTKLWQRLLYTIVLTLFIYVIYQYAFGLLLPEGLLFD